MSATLTTEVTLIEVFEVLQIVSFLLESNNEALTSVVVHSLAFSKEAANVSREINF